MSTKKSRKTVGGGFAQNPLGRPILMDREGRGGAGGSTVTTQDVEREYAPLLDAIDQRVEVALTPVRQQNAAIVSRMEQLSRPIHNAQALFGGPAVRRGEDAMGSRGISFVRLAALQSGQIPPEQAKLERSLSEQLRAHFEQHAFSMAVPHNSTLLVPLSADMLPEGFEQHGSDHYTRDDVRQMMAAEMGSPDPQAIRQMASRLGIHTGRINQALSMFDDTAMGIFTDPASSGSFIEMLKAAEVLSRVGATQVTLPPNGFMKFPRQTSASTGFWVGEAQNITPSEPGTGSLELRAKKCAAISVIPSELLRWGGPSAENFVRADLAAELGLTADKAGLEGAGTTVEPKGILNYSGILPYTAGAVGADGNEFSPQDPSGMLAAIEEENLDPDRDGFAWLMRGKMWRNILNRRSGALDSSDNIVEDIGQWLFDVNRAAIQNGQPGMLLGHPVYRSGQISNTRSKGGSSDLTYILGGVFRHLIIARAGVMEIVTSNSATIGGVNMFGTDQIGIRAIQHIDFGLRHQKAFVLCDEIDMDLPA